MVTVNSAIQLLGFISAAALAAAGLLMVVRLIGGKPALPDLRPGLVRAKAWLRPYVAALGVGILVLVLTRLPVAGLAAAVLVLLGPRLFGGGAVGRRQLAKIEAIAGWTESLRDTSSAASGLEQAIPATVSSAPVLLRAPVRELAARLDGRVPLPEALARFADDVEDPAADMVVAALSLNARQRSGGLERILTALAESARDELEMRRTVELERRALRRQAQRIGFGVIGFACLQAVFARGWLDPYSTPAGQLVLVALIAMFTGAFVRMRSLSASEPESRFLVAADQVADVASYRPQLSATRGLS